MKKTVIAYIRVSTRSQGDSGLGLSAQRKVIKDYFKGYEIIFYEEIASGTDVNRPIIKQALLHVEKVNGIFTAQKMDRIGRNTAFNIAFMNSLAKRKIETKVFDIADPENVLVYSIMSIFATFEADIISARTKAGLSRSTKKSGRPIGYKVNEDSKKKQIESIKNASYRKNKILLDKIKSLIDYAGKIEYDKITISLNNENITTPRGKEWTEFNVMRFIKRYREYLECE